MNLQYCPSVWTAKMELRSLQDELEGAWDAESPIPMGMRMGGGTHGIRPEARDQARGIETEDRWMIERLRDDH